MARLLRRIARAEVALVGRLADVVLGPRCGNCRRRTHGPCCEYELW